MPATHVEYAQAFMDFFPRTKAFLRSRGASPDLAEEIAQAAWARGWQRRAQLRDPASAGVWVNTIAFNLLRSGARRARRMVEADSRDAPVRPAYAAVLDAAKIQQACRGVERLLLQAVYIEGLTSEEAAVKAGLTPAAVRVRLLRCRRRLRERFGAGRPTAAA